MNFSWLTHRFSCTQTRSTSATTAMPPPKPVIPTRRNVLKISASDTRPVTVSMTGSYSSPAPLRARGKEMMRYTRLHPFQW